MNRYFALFLAALLLVPLNGARAAATWKEGQNYFRIPAMKRTTVPPGTVEVMEVFSYGCIACNQFVPVAKRLESSLPKNAKRKLLVITIKVTYKGVSGTARPYRFRVR